MQLNGRLTNGGYEAVKRNERVLRNPQRAGIAIAVMCLVGSAAIGVTAAAPAGADTASYSSTQIGTSGSTPTFNQSGTWTMSWNYNCSNFGSAGNFIVSVNQPAGSTTSDDGPNELSTSGSGIDHYYDSGTFHLDVTSECNWNITVTPASASAPAGTQLTITSAQVGDTGDTTAFFVAGPWTMAWSYNCRGLGIGRQLHCGCAAAAWRIQQ